MRIYVLEHILRKVYVQEIYWKKIFTFTKKIEKAKQLNIHEVIPKLKNNQHIWPRSIDYINGQIRHSQRQFVPKTIIKKYQELIDLYNNLPTTKFYAVQTDSTEDITPLNALQTINAIRNNHEIIEIDFVEGKWIQKINQTNKIQNLATNIIAIENQIL